MARLPRVPRFFPAGLLQHVVQRGNNRIDCFARDEDFTLYAHWLHAYATRFNVSIHAWVFMTNHVHLLVTPSTAQGVSMIMQSVGRRYVRYFNTSYKRSGTLWEGRFRSSVVESTRYLLSCYRYIELNRVRARLVNDPSTAE